MTEVRCGFLRPPAMSAKGVRGNAFQWMQAHPASAPAGSGWSRTGWLREPIILRFDQFVLQVW